MFGNTKEEVVQVDTTKLGVPASLVRAIHNLTNRRVQGIDSNLTAYLYVEEHHGVYAVGIQYEVPFNNDRFTVRHDIVVDSAQKAIEFFSGYALGDIVWIKGHQESYEGLKDENDTLKEQIAKLEEEINDLEEEVSTLKKANKTVHKEMITQAAKAMALETILKA